MVFVMVLWVVWLVVWVDSAAVTDTRVTPEEKRRFWLGAPKRRSNGVLSSMQKQTLKRPKSGSKFIHEQFPL